MCTSLFRRLGLLALCLLGAGSTAAIAQRGPSELPIQVDVDQATFAYSGRKTLLEVYMAFGASSLHYHRRQGSFHTQFPVHLVLRRNTDKTLSSTPTGPVWSDSTTFRFALRDTTNLTAGQHFIQQVRQTVLPGEYELELSIPGSADGTRKKMTLRRDIKVPEYDGSEDVALSGLVLASSIKRSNNRKSPFYKNGLAIRPNANQLFGQGLPRLFYYAEAYHPGQVAGADGEYTLYAYVARAGQLQPVNDLKKRFQHEARSPDILVGSFNVSRLPSGSYYLRLAVLDGSNEAAAQQARKFFVFNPKVKRRQASLRSISFESSPFASLPKEETEDELKQIEIIAKPSERARAGRLDSLEQKRRYLMRFWQRRDPKPNTATNEYRQRFKQQVRYANERYSTSFSEGWQTDRGRVLLKYGRPSEIEPHLYDRNKIPYEIWMYDNISGEGQSRFVFADREGFGRFDMIHSTVTGENSMADWQSLLQR